ncbi:MAG: hypothetical protein HXY50_15330 [Ignavibacteriaceae bacterium]|nr:hypothetical protein [Ignavibacteriaceae bacterium]
MELITILSTIILIATISTFILSIGAYILYKVRSRREQRQILSPVVNTQAELVTVKEADEWEELRRKSGRPSLSRVQGEGVLNEREKPEPKPVIKVEKVKTEKSMSPRFVKYNPQEIENAVGELKWK